MPGRDWDRVRREDRLKHADITGERRPATAPQKPRGLLARWPGICAECAQPYAAGARIARYPHGGPGWVHWGCR